MGLSLSSYALNRRSQIGVGDMFLAVSVFFIILVAVIFIYNGYHENFQLRKDFNRVQVSALETANVLVGSEGLPASWEEQPETALFLGLSEGEGRERMLSSGKVDAFINISYNRTRELFGTGYNFYFRITDIEGNVLVEKGQNIAGNRSAHIERRVLYDGEEAVLGLAFWE